jgi:hypothetical protein
MPDTARRRPLRALAFAALLSALPGMPRVMAAEPTLQPAEYEVLSQVINHGLPADTRAIAIGAQTTGDPDTLLPADADLEALAKRLDTAPGLLAGWAGLNQQRSPLARKLTLRARYELVPDALRAKIFEGEEPAQGWARFHARFPDAAGLLGVSRVAIDEARLNALVYIEFACGPECGTGRLVRLTRVDGLWQVQSGELLWAAGS